MDFLKTIKNMLQMLMRSMWLQESSKNTSKRSKVTLQLQVSILQELTPIKEHLREARMRRRPIPFISTKCLVMMNSSKIICLWIQRMILYSISFQTVWFYASFYRRSMDAIYKIIKSLLKGRWAHLTSLTTSIKEWQLPKDLEFSWVTLIIVRLPIRSKLKYWLSCISSSSFNLNGRHC